ncbi:MAG: S-layer homology domain-containing protein [Aedoeadaptatus pacaensis]
MERGDKTITINGNITVTETLVIDKNVKISGGTLTAGNLIKDDDPNSGNIFYVNKGKELKLDGVTLDGNKQSRLIYSNGGTITLNESTLENGCPGDKAKANPGGGVFLRGGSFTATDTKFTGNTPGTNKTLPKGDGDVNGGAIYSGSTSATITITGGSFENNEVKAYGHGAAIYQENGSLTVDGTSFKNNKGHVEGGNAGTQGACIHTRNPVTATIFNVEAEIAKGFNTGGFLRSLGSNVTVTDSKFTINSLGDGYGYSGGALCFQNGKSKVTGSTFTCTGSKLYHAGGFIDIVGGGTHVIDNNTMTGAGNDNNSAIASFGGAISVEQGAKATVTIKGNTITNSTASDNGGAIAIGTYRDGKTPKPKPGEDPVPEKTPSEVTMIGNKINNSGLIMWKGGAGGGVFVGPGATVTMSGDEIKDTKAPYGGGVYNEGDLNISGGASLTGGIALSLGGEIYNNGDLTVDNATITGNFVGPANWNQTPGHEKKYEHGGTNIYAAKDVTITPEANLAKAKDVRVLDGQSKILLTGPLTKEIDVSISEIAGGNEKANRKVGYVIAEGKGDYKATKADANFLHYIGRTNKEDANHYSNQPRAAYADDKSTGEWDFVLNPKTKEVVLGQRAKVTLLANGTDDAKAKFEGVEVGRNDAKGIFTTLNPEDQKEDIYDIYTSGEKLAELTPEPIRKGYAFTGWYKEAVVNDDAPDKDKDGKTLVADLMLVKDANEITSILDPSEYTLYAGWEKVIPVEKVWDDKDDEFGNRPDSVKVQLYLDNEAVGDPIELTADNGWKSEFKNLPEGNAEVKSYSVKEVPEQITGYTAGLVSGNATDGFKVTNSTEYITIKGSKTWVHDGNTGTRPTTVTVTLIENGKATEKKQNVDSWEFDNLPKYKNNQEVKYTLEEAPVADYTSTTSEDGYSFTNTYKKTYKVKYIFKSGTEAKVLPKDVMDLLPQEETGKENGATVTPKQPTSKKVDTADGAWTFNGWDPAETTINGADVTFEGTWTFTEKKSDFTVTKTVDKTEFEQAGDVLNYTVTVTNTGEKDLTGLTISDPKTTFDTPTFDLAKGETKEFKYAYTVTDNDVGAKAVNNTVTVTLDKVTKEDSTKSTLVEKKSDFTVTKTVDKTEFEQAGDVLNYTVTVTNTGEKDLTGLTISDPKTTFDTPTFDLAKGETKEFKYAYTVTEDDVKAKAVINKVTVTHENVPKTATTESKLKEDKPNPPTEIVTQYVDEQGNKLISDKEGAQSVVEIKGYTYLRTEKGKDVIRHIYKKVPEDNRNTGGFIVWKNEPVSDDGLLNKKDHKAYMFGYPDGNFLPDRNMTREEVTAMFARLLKDYPRERRSYAIPYKDVTERDWSYEAIGFMTEKGIIKGYEDGSFRPKEAISRAEFAAMAARFDKLVAGTGNPFNDVPDTHWAVASIDSAAAKGWVSGYPDGSFKPERKITRSEVVSITNIMLDRYADKDFVRGHLPEMIPFLDLTEANWAYFPIMEATHGHDYTRKAPQEENWIRLNGEEFRFPLLYRK